MIRIAELRIPKQNEELHGRANVLTLLLRVLFGVAAISSPVFAQTEVRFSTFNLSLNRDSAGQLVSDLKQPALADPAGNPEARRIEQAQRDAEIIQRVNPDVLFLNEFDYVTGEGGYEAVDLFGTNFIAAPQNNIAGTTGSSGLNFPYRFVAPSNTGIASGFDLNNNGSIVTTPGVSGYGDDAYGFGEYPGQYGMALLSKYPIERVRTFQNFLWKDMPGNLLNNDPSPAATNLATFYSAEERNILRLSSKSHWDVALNIGGTLVHVLVSHPTPPVFTPPKIAMANAIMTKSGFGRITSMAPPTCMTMPARSVASPPMRPSLLWVTRMRIRWRAIPINLRSTSCSPIRSSMMALHIVRVTMAVRAPNKHRRMPATRSSIPRTLPMLPQGTCVPITSSHRSLG